MCLASLVFGTGSVSHIYLIKKFEFIYVFGCAGSLSLLAWAFFYLQRQGRGGYSLVTMASLAEEHRRQQLRLPGSGAQAQ